MANVLDELLERGYIKQFTHEDETRELLKKEKITFYIGFDPTADSLHVGHFIAMMFMAHMQRAGHRPIALLGGGTAMVGDPSGKTDMRSMLTKEQIEHNVSCIKKQMEKFIDFSDDKAILVNNADWLLNLNYVDFLREVGVHFSVNRMLTAECFKQRLEKGLSFLEFNYMLMQGYDFYVLNQKYNCKMQLGGDDQWSNMIAGVELVRRKAQGQAMAMTCTLLTNSQGQKMGKTVGGALWLDPEKTSPFDFYQYWRNVGDADVFKCMRMLTFLSLEEIEAMEKWEDNRINEAKEVLAFELTKLVHSEEEAIKAQESSRALFSGAAHADMPTTEIEEADLTDGVIDLISLLVKGGLAPTRSEGRRNVEQGGVTVDGEKVTDFKAVFAREALEGDGIVVKRGKKKFQRIVVK